MSISSTAYLTKRLEISSQSKIENNEELDGLLSAVVSLGEKFLPNNHANGNRGILSKVILR